MLRKFSFVSIFLLFSFSFLWSLPSYLKVPSDTEVIWQDRKLKIVGREATVSYLRSHLNIEEINSFYEKMLAQEGWILSYRRDFEGKASLSVFTQKNKFFYVAIFGTTIEDKTLDFYLIESNDDLAVCNLVGNYLLKEELKEDMPGNDFSDILRYPGARRRLNGFFAGMSGMVMYEAQALPAEVVNFYRNILRNDGWQEDKTYSEYIKKTNIDPNIKEKVFLLQFYKGNDNLMLQIYSIPNSFNKERTIIIIIRNIDEDIIPLNREVIEKEIR